MVQLCHCTSWPTLSAWYTSAVAVLWNVGAVGCKLPRSSAYCPLARIIGTILACTCGLHDQPQGQALSSISGGGPTTR
eukprot:8960670-Lingulodinium_polyedra.AAC.1